MIRDAKIVLLALVGCALILLCPTIHCQSCITNAQVTLTGNLRSANGIPSSNSILTLTPSQQGLIAGCGVNLATVNTCATSTDGSVVGIQNPQTATVNTTSGGGSLPSGVYYTVYEWYDAAGHVTLVSPETATSLGATGTLVVNPPSSGVPALAVGMDVFISTSSETETLQGQTTGTASFVQSTALTSGSSPASTNTTLCQVVANDAVWPTGTGYNVSMVTVNGNPVPNYPMQWQLLGPGSTYNLSNGLPYYHGVVFYPVPILSQPANHGQQSISGPLNFGGYNVTGVGKLGVGTNFPGWGVDAEGSGGQGAVNAAQGYLYNGAAPSNHVLLGNGTYYIDSATLPCSVITGLSEPCGISGTPTITVGGDAGGGATAVCAAGYVCDNISGTVFLTAGTSPSLGPITYVAWSSTRANPPNCLVTFSFGNPLVSWFASTAHLQVNSVTTALSGGGEYYFTYLCTGQ